MALAMRLLLMFLVLATLAIAIFIAVALSTRLPAQEQSDVQHRGYAIRGKWFAAITLFLLAGFAATLPFFPYPSAAAVLKPSLRVPVIAEQYAFIMPSHFPVNQRIIFAVTSRDVNHGFGVYDPQGHLIAQVQAMPDYVNYLEVTFRQPGRYTIRCLEYCGIGHAMMEKTITVGGSR